MKIFFGIVGALLLYLVIELVVFWYRVDHLPKLTTIDQSDKTFGSGPVLRFIAAGDSVTVGAGASDLEHTYAFKVAKELSKTRTVEYRNIAVIGYKTQDVIDKQLAAIIAYKPDVVIISMGANDDTHLIPSDKVLSNFKRAISELEQKTTAKIYLSDIPNFRSGNLFPWFYVNLLELRSNELNPQILALENARTKMVDIHNFGIYKNPLAQIAYAADRFHPNNLGYQNWANAFLDKITLKYK